MPRKSSVARAAKRVPAIMIRSLLTLVAKAKDVATGKTWTRLHRVESELATIAGKKSALKRTMLKALDPKKKGSRRA